MEKRDFPDDTYIFTGNRAEKEERKIREAIANGTLRIFTDETETKKKKPDLRRGDPDEVLTVSRGLLNEDGRPGKSTPWSDDDNNAFGALYLLHRKSGFFEKGKIRRRDIDKMSPGGEEIFLQHEKLLESDYLELYGDEYMNGHVLRVSDRYTRFAELIDGLPFARESEIHGRPHEKRVLLLSLLIADALGLSDADAEALSYAAAYHDTGRVNDFAEEAHGEAGAEAYKAREKDNFDPAVYFVIKYHSISDKTGLEALRRDVRLSNDAERVKRLFSVFKDADALDRLRLGVDALDVNYLRNKASLQFYLLAGRLICMIDS